MSKRGIIDRFEEDWAIVEMEDGEFIDVPAHTLPSEAVEGSVILIEEKEKITVLTEETHTQRAKVKALIDKLFDD